MPLFVFGLPAVNKCAVTVSLLLFAVGGMALTICFRLLAIRFILFTRCLILTAVSFRGFANTKYDAFLIAEENAFQGTADKVTANNTIYDKMVSLCLDGQTLYSKDEIRKALFSMEAVAALIRPTGTATVAVELTNSETAQPYQHMI